jgi:superfamily II DNA or RNA helicase
MARVPVLSYDRGTLILHPPPRGRAWVDHAEWDDRVERFRIPADRYRPLVEALQAEGTSIDDQARAFCQIERNFAGRHTPHAHQAEALSAWKAAGRRGVVVLPTGAGKTLVAQLALQSTPRSALIVVPTLDLMHQWYAGLLEAFPGSIVGLLGGGSRDFDATLLIATYVSAASEAERLGNRFALLIFDEVHHLPADYTRVIAEYSIAPYRLGLTATPTRGDGREADLASLVGPTVYSRAPAELAGCALAPFDEVRIRVALGPQERARYEELIARRNRFLEDRRIFLGSLDGWRRFIRASASSPAGRAAMLAHRQAKAIAFGTEEKFKALDELLVKHAGRRTLIFTDDTATVYRVANDYLLPAITHQTPIKERHETLARFRAGRYPVIVSSRVLNEGVDVPEASVAIVLSGTGTEREYIQRLGRVLRPVEGKRAILYEIIAEKTSEEGVSRRRRGGTKKETRAEPLRAAPPGSDMLF